MAKRRDPFGAISYAIKKSARRTEWRTIMANAAAAPIIVVEIDVMDGKFRVMNAPGGVVQKARAKDFSLSMEKINRGQYVEALEEVLPAVSPLFKQIASFSLTVILPASMLALDMITIPTMSRSQMDAAFKAEIKNQYKNLEDLQINPQIFTSNKKATVYLLSMIKKSLLTSIKDVFSKHAMPFCADSFAPLTTANSLFQLRPKVKKENVLFVDIRENGTNIVMTEKERIVGFLTLPFGTGILKSNRIVGENTIYDDDVAALAVLNAKESARAKQLTKSITLESDDYTDEDEEDGAKPQQSAAPKEETEEIPIPTDIPPMDLGNYSEEEMLKMIGEMHAEDEANKSPVKAEKVFMKKEGRKLPKFMQRELPNNEQEYVYENFRYILKRILLFERQCKRTEIMPEPAFTVLNMPSEYAFLLNILNEDKEANMKFLYFDPKNENNPDVTKNLAAYGGYFASVYNKNQVF